MNQEDKELLLIDLCARLSYGVKGLHRGQVHRLCTIDSREVNNACIQVDGYDTWFSVDTFRPYLRPVYSMTEEEMDTLFDILHIDKEGKDDDWIKINDVMGIKFFLSTGRWMEEMDEALRYLRKIHIDIYDFIRKGLALKEPEEMYK